MHVRFLGGKDAARRLPYPVFQWRFKIKKLIAIFLTLLITGCSSTINIKEAHETDDHNDVYGNYVKKSWIENGKIYIEIQRESGAVVVDLKPIVYKNDIYLKALRISGRGGLKVFTIDLDQLDFKLNDNSNVYMIVSASWDGLWQVITHKGPLPQHVDRQKLNLIKQAQNQ